VPEKRHRMNPTKLAKRRELYLAVHALLQDRENPNRCKNVVAAHQWMERLHQAHFDRLNELRREMNIHSPIFPLAFALSSRGRALELEGVWEAVLSCTTHTSRVEFVDPPKKGTFGHTGGTDCAHRCTSTCVLTLQAKRRSLEVPSSKDCQHHSRTLCVQSLHPT
jgi:hypothetical protein